MLFKEIKSSQNSYQIELNNNNNNNNININISLNIKKQNTQKKQ